MDEEHTTGEGLSLNNTKELSTNSNKKEILVGYQEKETNK